MNAMPSPIQPDFPAGLPVRGTIDSSSSHDLDGDPFAGAVERQHPERAGARRSSSRLSLFLTFCFGVGVTVAWYSFGGPVREAIAGMSPQLAWVAPQQAPAAEGTSADPAAPAATPAPSVDQQLSAASADIDNVKQSVDRIATAQDKIIHSIDQLSAGQELLTKEIVKLQAVEQYILYKNSESPAPRAAATPAVRKPAAPLPLSPANTQATPAAPAAR